MVSAGSDSIGEYGTAAISLFRNPGLPRAGRAVYIRIEQVPGNRSHVRLLRALWNLAEQPEVKLVALVLKSEPAASFAHAEEVADALRLLRAKGKKTLCHLEDSGGRSLYVCANADRILINPAGGLRYSGLRTQHFYLAKLLENLGVKAEFVRIGAHKSAPEQFMNEGPSPTAKADQLRLLGNVEAVFVKNLATYRHLEPAKIRAATLQGPFVASEARQVGFVDGFAFDDELPRVAGEMMGGPIAWQKYAPEAKAPNVFGGRGKVGLLYVDGDIVDGRSQNVPILGNRLIGSYTIADTVKALRDDRDIEAVVLRIESPGGSSMASDVMWRELTLLAKKKPLIVSMGSVAASGGYYIATAADTIYAEPLTITGSIGIFYGKADLSRLLDRIGVHVETNRTTPRADAESLFRGFTPDERQELQHKIGQFYDVFLDRVAQGRRMSKAEVDAVGQGAVWYGQEALGHKLVDRLGGLREALAEARARGHLRDDAPIVEVPDVDKHAARQGAALRRDPRDHTARRAAGVAAERRPARWRRWRTTTVTWRSRGSNGPTSTSRSAKTTRSRSLARTQRIARRTDTRRLRFLGRMGDAGARSPCEGLGDSGALLGEVFFLFREEQAIGFALGRRVLETQSSRLLFELLALRQESLPLGFVGRDGALRGFALVARTLHHEPAAEAADEQHRDGRDHPVRQLLFALVGAQRLQLLHVLVLLTRDLQLGPVIRVGFGPLDRRELDRFEASRFGAFSFGALPSRILGGSHARGFVVSALAFCGRHRFRGGELFVETLLLFGVDAIALQVHQLVERKEDRAFFLGCTHLGFDRDPRESLARKSRRAAASLAAEPVQRDRESSALARPNVEIDEHRQRGALALGHVRKQREAGPKRCARGRGQRRLRGCRAWLPSPRPGRFPRRASRVRDARTGPRSRGRGGCRRWQDGPWELRLRRARSALADGTQSASRRTGRRGRRTWRSSASRTPPHRGAAPYGWVRRRVPRARSP